MASGLRSQLPPSAVGAQKLAFQDPRQWLIASRCWQSCPASSVSHSQGSSTLSPPHLPPCCPRTCQLRTTSLPVAPSTQSSSYLPPCGSHTLSCPCLPLWLLCSGLQSRVRSWGCTHEGHSNLHPDVLARPPGPAPPPLHRLDLLADLLLHLHGSPGTLLLYCTVHLRLSLCTVQCCSMAVQGAGSVRSVVACPGLHVRMRSGLKCLLCRLLVLFPRFNK